MKELIPFFRPGKDKLQVIEKFTEFGYIINDQEYYDALSNKWDFSLGFQRHDIIDYVSDRMKEFPACKFAKTVPGVLELNELLSDIIQMDQVTYCTSGSDAVETAIRMARLYNNRKHIIVYEGSYHGSTYLTSAATGINVFHRIVDKPDWIHFVPQNDIQAVEAKIAEIGPSRVSCILKEPFSYQSASPIPSKQYYSDLKDLCAKHDIVLVADEVATGFGRTGEWFGCQRMGFEPDIIAFGKACTAGYFPLAGAMCNDKISHGIRKRFFASGFTHSPPMSGVYACIKTINIVKEEKLLQNAYIIEDMTKDLGFAYGCYLSVDVDEPIKLYNELDNNGFACSRSFSGDSQLRFLFQLNIVKRIRDVSKAIK